MQDSMIRLLKSYLTGRKFRVKLDSHFSEWKPIHAGVPQGSVLAPLLYNVYVSDIPRRPGIEISQFADDIAAYIANKKNQLRQQQPAEIHARPRSLAVQM
jgi:hypothetical protein